MEDYSSDEKEALRPLDIQPFCDAVIVANIEEEQELLQEDENAASVNNPNVSDNRHHEKANYSEGRRSNVISNVQIPLRI